MIEPVKDDVSEEDIFSKEEQEILDKTKKQRLAIIDDLTLNGVPRNEDKLSLLLETLDSSDKQIMNQVKLRNQVKTSKNEANDMVAMVAEIFKHINVDKNDNIQVNKNREVIISDEHIPTDIVPGETDIVTNPLTLEDFGLSK